MSPSFGVANEHELIAPPRKKKQQERNRGEHLVRRTAVCATTREPPQTREHTSLHLSCPPFIRELLRRSANSTARVPGSTESDRHSRELHLCGSVPDCRLRVRSISRLCSAPRLSQRPPLLLPSRQGDAVSVRRRATKTGWAAENFRWGDFQI